MATIIIDGVPGSGKTLYAVHHLIKNHYHDVAGIYEKKTPFLLVSNIDNLQLDHVALQESIDSVGKFEKFFSKDYQEKLFESVGPVIYVIDEAQFFFHRKFYDKDVFAWFQYHRHFGQSIYLITQNVRNLPTEVLNPTEYTIRAVPRSRTPFNKLFHYNLLSGSDLFGRETVKAKKEYFNLYRSQMADTPEAVKRPFVKTALVNLLFAFVALGGGIWFLFDKMGGDHLEEKHIAVAASQTTVSVSGAPAESGVVNPAIYVPKLDNWQPISVIVQTSENRQVVYIADKERLIPHVFFPHKIKLIEGQYYANLPADYSTKSEKTLDHPPRPESPVVISADIQDGLQTKNG